MRQLSRRDEPDGLDDGDGFGDDAWRDGDEVVLKIDESANVKATYSKKAIQEVLDYFQGRTKVLKEGQWIVLQQVFITRLREQRYPTRAELDRVAPHHPAVFRTGPDASVNSLALELSGIHKNFKVTDGGTGFIARSGSYRR